MAAATASKQTKQVISENIFLLSSNDANVPSGKVYKVLNRKDMWFIINKNGQRVQLDEVNWKWEPRDEVVLLVKVLSSVLQSIEAGEVYRVYDDAKHDERYILDKHNEKVLFDKNIFKWEVI
ncbi:MAG: hypothetical protein IPM82_10370 [Saprospiraceae bacterium]|nr:hypothetical protein [Saprospiraceae bacterium]